MNVLKALGGLFLFSTLIQAQEQKNWKHDFEIGFEIQHFHYKEPRLFFDRGMNMDQWMEEKGYLLGGSVAYQLTSKEGWFIRPEGRFVAGKEGYKNGFHNIYNRSRDRDTGNWIFETRLLFGGNISLTENFTISPYTGVGYRKKVDDGLHTKLVKGKQNLAFRKSNYVYIPAGAFLNYTINDTWGVSFRMEYDHLMKGLQYSHDRHLVRPVHFHQHGGYGIKGEFSVNYKAGSCTLSAGPYIHYWHVNKSDYARALHRGEPALGVPPMWGTTYEPANNTIESGFKISVKF